MTPNNKCDFSENDIASLFDYNKETGELRWRARSPVTLADRQWNGRFAGKLAGTLRKDGYLRVKVGSRYLLVHRVVWVISYGEFPDKFIDHINGNRSDNRLSNLREANKSENCTNCRTNPNTGYKGIRFDERYQTYQVRLTKNGKTIHLGQARTIEEAVRIYNENVEKVHGEFGITQEVL